MGVKIKYPFLLLAFLIFCFSCQSQESNRKKNIEEILNVVLAEYDSIYLIKETFYFDKSLIPDHILNVYLRVYNSKKNTAAYQLFYKDFENIITLEELKEMKKRYGTWSLEEWKSEDINSEKVEIILFENRSYLQTKPVIRLSEPLFTADGKKAILYESYVKHGTGGVGIKILVKENGKWKMKGAIPNGTVG